MCVRRAESGALNLTQKIDIKSKETRKSIKSCLSRPVAVWLWVLSVSGVACGSGSIDRRHRDASSSTAQCSRKKSQSSLARLKANFKHNSCAAILTQSNIKPGTAIEHGRRSMQREARRPESSLTTQVRAELSSNSTVDSTTPAVHPDCISGASLCISGASLMPTSRSARWAS